MEMTRRDTRGMRSVRRGAALSVSVVVVAAVGSGTAIALSRGTADSGVKGRVVPCGIVLERPAPCAVPSKHVSLVVGQGDHVVRRAKLRDGGRFRVPLAAGRYWLQPRAGRVRGQRTRVTVADGEWTTVTIPAGRVSPPSRVRSGSA
jgi:hypothetical protein